MKKFQSDPRVTVPSISQRKNGDPIVALTAYDYTIAVLLDRSGVDIILVGDSLGNIMQGHPTTLPVTLEQIIYHTQCVARGATRALVVADMPFLSYQPSVERAIESAGRLLKEGNASAVKLEGGTAVAETVRRIVEFDIPVMGHVGLTPQSFHRMGGHRKQGKTGAGLRSADKVFEDALALEEAGAFAVVLEGIPDVLAEKITNKLQIPTIGIGASPHCDGQILVTHDLIGLTVKEPPPFVKQQANLSAELVSAVERFKDSLNQASTVTRKIATGT